jgi:hypothetical protein
MAKWGGTKLLAVALGIAALISLVSFASRSSDADGGRILEHLEPFPNGDAAYAPGEPPPSTVLMMPGMLALLAEAGWPPHLAKVALGVAGCESGWDTTVTGKLGEYGLFQIHPVHTWRFRAEFGDDADPYDPIQNAAIAFEIWEEERWHPWSCAPS